MGCIVADCATSKKRRYDQKLLLELAGIILINCGIGLLSTSSNLAGAGHRVAEKANATELCEKERCERTPLEAEQQREEERRDRAWAEEERRQNEAREAEQR